MDDNGTTLSFLRINTIKLPSNLDQLLGNFIRQISMGNLSPLSPI